MLLHYYGACYSALERAMTRSEKTPTAPTPPTSPTSPILSICSTCTDTSAPGEEGIGGGARLLARVREAAGDTLPVRIGTNRCLMACTQGCVVSLAQTGKMQYLLGRLPADAGAAEALVSFARQYAESPSGIVPNAEWPEMLAMHFIGRIAPTEPAEGVEWREDGGDL